MLELLRKQGFAVVEADPDDGFPGLAGSLTTANAVAEAPLDLVWASSSLHHVANPARHAQQWFARFSHLAALTAGGRHAVEDLLRRFSEDVELEPRATRTVWVATPD